MKIPIISSFVEKISNIKESAERLNLRVGIIDNIGVISKLQQILTYENVIGYFTLERPVDVRVKKMLVRFLKNNKGYVVTFLFLDSDDLPLRSKDGILYGKQIVTNALDEELMDLFNVHSNGIIFQ